MPLQFPAESRILPHEGACYLPPMPFRPTIHPSIRLPAEADRVVISVSPLASPRTACRVEALQSLLEKQGLQIEVRADLAEVAHRANGWHTAGRLRALVGVGGDGTAAELVNRTAVGVPLALLPSGNENLLARYLKIGNTPEECCSAILGGKAVCLDAARANTRIFLIVAGCGLDAEVVRRLHGQRRGPVGRAHYIEPLLSAVRSYHYPELQVHWSEQDCDAGSAPLPPACVRWLFACNLPCYGGGLTIAEGADATDGLLDVCSFSGGGLWNGLRYAAAVLLRQHRRMADFAVRRVGRVRITADAEVPYQLDGDPGGVLPLEIEVLPGRLTLVVPEGGLQAED
jgi:diacylglycerol kinase (ATP)